MLNILHVEDNLVDQMALSRLLKKENILVSLTNAETLQEAKKLLSEENFELIICDLNLPDGTAFELAEYFPGVPAILHTGHLDEHIQDKSRKSGAFKLLLKSGDLKPLLDEIKSITKTPVDSDSSVPIADKTDKVETTPIIQHLMSVFGNDQKYVEEVILTYMDENPLILERLQQAGQNNETEQVVKSAHQLKSGYLLMGLKTLKSMAESLELHPPESQNVLLDKIQELQQLSFQSYDHFKTALQNLNNQS